MLRPVLTDCIAERIEEVMGRCIWDDHIDAQWEQCTVPKGSEGSLFYWYQEESCTVVIRGNLRDFGEEESEIAGVVDWFRGCLSKVRELEVAGIDSAILQLNRSRHPTQVWTWLPVNNSRMEYHLVPSCF